MAQVKVAAQRLVEGDADRVYTAVSDYTGVRPRVLPANYSDYDVQTGGHGAGTRVSWKLAATEKRVRDCVISVTEPKAWQLVERDANSSMVTTWTVSAAGQHRSTVRIETTWKGAGGVGGFFEKTFAPMGLRRIYDELLGNLANLLRET